MIIDINLQQVIFSPFPFQIVNAFCFLSPKVTSILFKLMIPNIWVLWCIKLARSFLVFRNIYWKWKRGKSRSSINTYQCEVRCHKVDIECDRMCLKILGLLKPLDLTTIPPNTGWFKTCVNMTSEKQLTWYACPWNVFCEERQFFIEIC